MNRLHLVGCCAVACILTACIGSPPKPPTVNGSDRQAVNDSATAARLADQANLARKPVLIMRGIEAAPIKVQPLPSSPSRVLTLTFPFNSAHFKPSVVQEAELLAATKNACRIEIKGRTDADHPSPGDENVALKRAQAAKNYLVAHGVAITKISINYVSGGQYVADNNTANGRAQNRRVEIEIFNQ